jgi:hypothetical protein
MFPNLVEETYINSRKHSRQVGNERGSFKEPQIVNNKDCVVPILIALVGRVLIYVTAAHCMLARLPLLRGTCGIGKRAPFGGSGSVAKTKHQHHGLLGVRRAADSVEHGQHSKRTDGFEASNEKGRVQQKKGIDVFGHVMVGGARSFCQM